MKLELTGLEPIAKELAFIGRMLWAIANKMDKDPSPVRKAGETDAEFFPRLTAWEARQS